MKKPVKPLALILAVLAVVFLPYIPGRRYKLSYRGWCPVSGADGMVMAAEKEKADKLKGARVKNRSRLRVLSSRNYLFPGGEIYLCADLVSRSLKHRAVMPEWKIEPPLKGITVSSEGVVQADKKLPVTGGRVIHLVASYQGRRADKPLKLMEADPHPALHRVHYFRYDGNFDGWNLWTWNPKGKGRQAPFVERTDFGAIGGVNDSFAIIRYLDWFAKETGDLDLSGADDVYVVEGDTRVYRDFSRAVRAGRPRITGAIMDRRDRVTARLPMKPPPGTRFHLFMNDRLLATAKAHGHDLVFNITRAYDFDPSALFYIRASRLYHDSPVLLRGVFDEYYYPGADMGAVFDEKFIRLRVWAPGAAKVRVILPGKDGDDLSKAPSIPLERAGDGSGTWVLSLDRKKHYGGFYIYEMDFHPDTPFARTTRGVDPYARAVSVNGRLGVLIDVVKDPLANPDGWKPMEKPPMSAPEDSVIYELHVRDFSMDPDSGIPKECRGKFLAFTKTRTTLPGKPGVKTGIDHLKELGITHLHLLPVYDFATVDESKINDPEKAGYNWGYDPKNYNAPEGSYSTNPKDPYSRVRELKEMVAALHNNGIRVVMDVVYNHTYDTTVFEPFVRGYYYRTDLHGRFTNGSGCGNEVATEHPMVRKFVVDSVVHWARTYGFDGFRFDLMGIIDRDTMKEVTQKLHRVDPTILIYGEPWGGGASSLSASRQIYKGSQKMQGYAVFNDNLRNALRGDNSVPHPSRAFATGSFDNSDSIRRGVTGAIDDFTSDPGEAVNYVACHDNLTLWDQVAAAMGHNFPHPYVSRRSDGLKIQGPVFDDRVKRVLLSYGVVFTSQGIPFVAAGDEMLRTKFGDHNSYKSPDSINSIRWRWKGEQKRVFDYFRGLVTLRREHGAFRMRTAQQVRKHLKWLETPPGVVAFRLTDNANGDSWKTIAVIYNPRDQVVEMNLPGGPWTVVVNDRQAGTLPVAQGYSVFNDRVMVAPVSMMVLHDSP